MGCKANPSSNGSCGNGGLPGSAYTTVKISLSPSNGDITRTTSSRYQTIRTIIKSMIPLIMFLLLYGANQVLHMLPRFTDIDCVQLFNVSAWESTILGDFAPHKFISSHSSPLLDILSAMPYLLHYFIPVVYPLYLYWRGQHDDVCRFFWLLGWCMWLHYIIWFLLPTAPPWVYDNWSRFSSNSTTPPFHLQHKEGCAFARLDARFGLNFFFNMFASNPVPFASFPSGHVSWPMCIYMTWAPGGKYFIFYVIWVAWATLYSCHHYLSDALCAVLMVIITKRILLYLSERRPRDQFSCPAIVCPLSMV